MLMDVEDTQDVLGEVTRLDGEPNSVAFCSESCNTLQKNICPNLSILTIQLNPTESKLEFQETMETIPVCRDCGAFGAFVPGSETWQRVG
jgi:hypothetical protein